jgi:glycosyltransferase involved in cell wall biosynthesis
MTMILTEPDMSTTMTQVDASFTPIMSVAATRVTYFCHFQGSIVPPEHMAAEMGKESVGGQTVAVLEMAAAAAEAGDKVTILARSHTNTNYELSYNTASGATVTIAYLADGVEGQIRKEDLYPQLPLLGKAAADYVEAHYTIGDQVLMVGNYPTDGGFPTLYAQQLLKTRAPQRADLKEQEVTKIPLTALVVTHSVGAMKEAQVGDDPACRFPVRKLTERLVFDGLDAIVAVGPQEKTVLVEQYGVSPNRVTFVPNGVNKKTFHRMQDAEVSQAIANGALPEWKKEYEGRQLIVGVSRFVESKGILEAIVAMAEVKEALMIYAGAPSAAYCAEKPSDPSVKYFKLCQEKIVELGLQEHVQLWPSIKHEQAALLFNKAQQSGGSGIAPSTFEPFGLVPLEMFICKLPVILSNRSGLSACLDPEKPQALLVDPSDRTALVGGMRTMLNEDATRENYGYMGLNEANSNYLWEHTWARISEIAASSADTEPLIDTVTLERFAKTLDRGWGSINALVTALDPEAWRAPYASTCNSINFSGSFEHHLNEAINAANLYYQQQEVTAR